MVKPKGGRGKAAPYQTTHVRIPDPILTQVNNLVFLYHNHLAQGGDPNDPPDFLKPVNRFSESLFQAQEILDSSLKLKANAGGAIKEKVKEAIMLLQNIKD
jgi:hypothetical protein